MQEGNISDEQLKTVLENSASAANYLHFALIPMETEML